MKMTPNMIKKWQNILHMGHKATSDEAERRQEGEARREGFHQGWRQRGFVLGEAIGGLSDFHDDLKALFDTENIMKAWADFFEKRSRQKSKVEGEMESIGSENSKN